MKNTKQIVFSTFEITTIIIMKHKKYSLYKMNI